MKCYAIFTNKPNLKSFESIRTRRFNSILCIFHTIYGYSPQRNGKFVFLRLHTYTMHTPYFICTYSLHFSWYSFFFTFTSFRWSLLSCSSFHLYSIFTFIFCKMGCFIIFPMRWTGLSSLKKWNDILNQIYTMIVSKENPFCFFFQFIFFHSFPFLSSAVFSTSIAFFILNCFFLRQPI